MKADIQSFLNHVKERNTNEEEFLQAVEEVVESVWDFYLENPDLYSTCPLSRVLILREDKQLFMSFF